MSDYAENMAMSEAAAFELGSKEVEKGIDRVLDEIGEKLSSEKKREIEEARETCRNLVTEFGLEERVKDVETAQGREAIILLTAVAKRWKECEGKTDESSQKNYLRKIIKSIYPKADGGVSEETNIRQGRQLDAFIGAMIASPEFGIEGMNEVDRKSFAEIYHEYLYKQIGEEEFLNHVKKVLVEQGGQKKAMEVKDLVKSIAETPLSLNKAHVFLVKLDENNETVMFVPPVNDRAKVRFWKAFEEVREDVDWRAEFSGAISSRDRNMILAYPGFLSVRVLEHEVNHMRYSQTHVGLLGNGVNEALTDLLAVEEEQVYFKNVSKLEGVMVKMVNQLSSGAGYQEEIGLFYELFDIVPGLREAIIERYKSGSIDSSNKTMQLFIDKYGIDGFLDLMLVEPLQKAPEGIKKIKLSVEEAREKLKLKKSL